jgi:chaperonin cofactor prefoldin
MARDKLITIRIEGEKRDAFNQLAKSQNTDTASLLYDFISGCLDSRIDISLVTEKGQRIDNQLDDDRLNKIDNRIDKLETTTQRLAKRLDDWIEAIDDRLTDCDQGLSEKIITLEHRINALSFQLDRQDSQEIDDMERLLRLQREASIATSPLPPSPPDRPAIETLPTVETVSTDSSIEPVTDAIETVRGDSDSIDTEPGEAVTIGDKPWYTVKELLDCHYQNWPGTRQGLQEKADREQWPKRTRRGSKGNPYEYQAVLPSQGKG